MIRIGELILTKGHPIFLDNCWKRPDAVGAPYSPSEEITEVYNFILSGSRSSIFVNGFEVATLGTLHDLFLFIHLDRTILSRCGYRGLILRLRTSCELPHDTTRLAWSDPVMHLKTVWQWYIFYYFYYSLFFKLLNTLILSSLFLASSLPCLIA